MLMGRTGPTGGIGCILQMKIPARRVLGPQLKNWQPAADDQMVLLGRKDMCCQGEGSIRAIKQGKADTICLIKSMPCASALALKDAV